jgi:pimeloyl-ACP methyl ester carboxylesterase
MDAFHVRAKKVVVDGVERSIVTPGGLEIGLVTAGHGAPLLLVHGGIGSARRWSTIWPHLTAHWRVSAMDRRGRGSSSDPGAYSAAGESADIAAIAARLAEDHDGPIDVFAHGIGATFTIGAAASTNDFRRIVLYEPPGAAAMSAEGWAARVASAAAEGRTDDVATFEREAQAMESIDLVWAARSITVPVMLMLGSQSPEWARDITKSLAETIPKAEVATLVGEGHEAIDTAPEIVVRQLERFLEDGR